MKQSVVTGKSAFRLALLAGLLALGFEWCRLVGFAYEHPGAGGNSGNVNVELAVVAFLGLVALATVLWIRGYELLQALLTVVQSLLSWRVTDESWSSAVGRSVARLPRATLFGAVAWIVYSALRLGGWLGDFFFGALAWLVGAWCAWPLLRAILRGRRTPSAVADEPGR